MRSKLRRMQKLHEKVLQFQIKTAKFDVLSPEKAEDDINFEPDYDTEI